MEVSDTCYVQILLTASLGRKEQNLLTSFSITDNILKQIYTINTLTYNAETIGLSSSNFTYLIETALQSLSIN